MRAPGSRRCAKQSALARRKKLTAAITLLEACEYLRLSIGDFRKLCILRGLRPRKMGRRLNEASETAVVPLYGARDIRTIAQDPLISFFRDRKAWGRRIARARAQSDAATCATLLASKPHLPINRIVADRYGVLGRALLELGDALTLLYVVPDLCAHPKIGAARADAIAAGLQIFERRIEDLRCLRAVFLAARGTYMTAKIHDVDVTWIVPMGRAQDRDLAYVEDPEYGDVIRLSIKLYERLLKQINRKLLEECDAQARDAEAQGQRQDMFRGLVFLFADDPDVERTLGLAVRAFGGEVAPADATTTTTHVITDDLDAAQDIPISCDVVRAQWVADSINLRRVLPVDAYHPTLDGPPHLSPYEHANMEKRELAYASGIARQRGEQPECEARDISEITDPRIPVQIAAEFAPSKRVKRAFLRDVRRATSSGKGCRSSTGAES